jgi:hypothetical protein
MKHSHEYKDWFLPQTTCIPLQGERRQDDERRHSDLYHKFTGQPSYLPELSGPQTLDSCRVETQNRLRTHEPLSLVKTSRCKDPGSGVEEVEGGWVPSEGLRERRRNQKVTRLVGTKRGSEVSLRDWEGLREGLEYFWLNLREQEGIQSRCNTRWGTSPPLWNPNFGRARSHRQMRVFFPQFCSLDTLLLQCSFVKLCLYG